MESEILPARDQPPIRVEWLWNGLDALDEPSARGIQRESAASPLPRLRVLPRTSCNYRYKQNHKGALAPAHGSFGMQ